MISAKIENHTKLLNFGKPEVVRTVVERHLRNCVDHVLNSVGESASGEYSQAEAEHRYQAALANAQVTLTWNAVNGQASLIIENAPHSLQTKWQQLFPTFAIDVRRILNQIPQAILAA